MFRLVIFSCLFLATFAASIKRPSQERILGGHNTYINEVPYQVSVQYDQHHLCGGSILGPQHVVTAAHCIEDNDPMEFAVRVGSEFHNYGGQYINVKSAAKHPKYNSSTSNYDVAVLKLEEPLTFGNTVKSVPLANTEPTEGETVKISGWGVLKEDEEEDMASYLQTVKVPVAPRKTCERKLKILNLVSSVMFCAGYPSGGKDACLGDSGGPAVVDGKLAGIISWGEGCGHSHSPGIYTSVAAIRHWIKTQTLE